MANIVEDLEVWFTNLTATHVIASNFGTTFTSNENLFLMSEPASPTNCLIIIPYPGRAPDIEHRNAQYPSVQVRVRNVSVPRAYKVTQCIINTWHNNTSNF